MTTSAMSGTNATYLEAHADLPKKWVHIVSSGAEDNGLHFAFSWLSPAEAASELWRGQGDWIKLL